jgi:hypothetical protein
MQRVIDLEEQVARLAAELTQAHRGSAFFSGESCIHAPAVQCQTVSKRWYARKILLWMRHRQHTRVGTRVWRRNPRHHGRSVHVPLSADSVTASMGCPSSRSSWHRPRRRTDAMNASTNSEKAHGAHVLFHDGGLEFAHRKNILITRQFTG